MKRSLFVSLVVVFLIGFFASSVVANDALVKFNGGIGVIPISNVLVDPATGAITVNRNIVRGVNSAGQIWVIEELSARVSTNGDIKVKGKGLLLGGGNNIGTTGATGNSVFATLFCDSQAFSTSPAVQLKLNGDFEIKDTLDPLPLPAVCANPVLLLRSGGNQNWFAAGIPDLD